MTTDSGFVKAQSDNMPNIDAFMMSAYFANNKKYTSAEMKGAKAARSLRESYGDQAIGYVQVHRDGHMCTVKARITPEHNVHNKNYTVTAVCNEAEEEVISVNCKGCAAHLGGCKHEIAFLAWLHRRSEDPPTTSVECYWSKSKLSSVGTSLKFIKAKDMCGTTKSPPLPSTNDTVSFLTKVLEQCKVEGDTENHLMKFYTEPTNVEKLSVHQLWISSKARNSSDFIEHCKHIMTANACKEAELATMGQNDCPLWHELRYGRITASKAYEAAHCKVLDGTLAESIMGATKLRDTEPMKRGRLLENEVIKVVERIRKINIKKCGLKLNSTCPIMGASPDGESDMYSIEIKCPASEQAISRYISSDREVASKYMGQVQLQMHFSNKTEALFCVAACDFETSKKVTIIDVHYDRELCEDLLARCSLFWNKAVFPMISKFDCWRTQS